MVLLRCTHKLRERMRQENVSPISPSTTVLGDWYCNLIYFGRMQIILCASEKTLMPILIPARDSSAFHARLKEALAITLAAFNIHPDAIQLELNQMNEYQIAPTANRSVLGSLNDFERMASFIFAQPVQPSLEEVSATLSDTPCSPIGYKSPKVATIERFKNPNY